MLEKLFNLMKNDIYVMSEYSDSEEALWEELSNSTPEILQEYWEIYRQ